MRVVFAGPSLADSGVGRGDPRLTFRPPAAQGDIARAVLDGANVIGLIDGVFENVAAVWHKEILYALSAGVQTFGAASMGALRAAECAPFGMVGVGRVFDDYASGRLIDDDAVAQVHGPEELRHMALSEPLVNIEATLDVLLARRLIEPSEDLGLRARARALFFKERTYERLLSLAGLPAARQTEIAKLIALHRKDQKREDAEELVARVAAAPDARIAPPGHWRFAETEIWMRLLDGIARQAGVTAPRRQGPQPKET